MVFGPVVFVMEVFIVEKLLLNGLANDISTGFVR